MGPTVSQDLLSAATREDERTKKTAIHCVRLPHNQHLVLSAYARSAGMEVPAFIRRIVKEWMGGNSNAA